MVNALFGVFVCAWVLSTIAFVTLASQEDYEVKEEDFVQPEYFEVEATAYCDGEVCCRGEIPRYGICAGKPEWYGKIIALYESNNGKIGEFIGYFECLDTGSERIKNGEVIDIFNPSREWCLQFGRKKVIAIIIEGRG